MFLYPITPSPPPCAGGYTGSVGNNTDGGNANRANIGGGNASGSADDSSGEESVLLVVATLFHTLDTPSLPPEQPATLAALLPISVGPIPVGAMLLDLLTTLAGRSRATSYYS